MNVQLPVQAGPWHNLPKIELHVHLEGGFSLEEVAHLAKAAGEPLPKPLDELYDFTDLDSFLSLLDWWCGLVRNPEQASGLAYDFAKFLSTDNVVYAEVIVNPTHWRGLKRPDLLQAVSDGFDQAQADGFCDCRISPSLLRQQSAEEAMELVEELDHGRPKRVVALSIDGNQAVPSAGNARFITAFKAARESGLGTTAHAGESSGPEGVRSALDELGVQRIDHGVRAVEDPALLRRLAEEQITLNVCLSSNTALLYHDINRHPLPRLLEASVPVTINTDDPMLLATTMSREIELATSLCRLGINEVVAIMHQAATAAFCEPRRSNELHSLIDQWATNIKRHHEHPSKDSTS